MTPADIIYSRRCHVIERAAIVGVARAYAWRSSPASARVRSHSWRTMDR
jgi:hypothetical protein